MRRHSLIVLVTAVVGAVASAGGITVAMADIPDSGVINGCYQTSGGHQGALTVIDTSARQACPRESTPLSWNQAGPQGPPGLPGPAGPSTAGPGGLDVVLAQSSGTNTGRATAYCPPDHPYVISGGFTAGPVGITIVESIPVLGNGNGIGEEGSSGNGWQVQSSAFPNGGNVGAYAACAK